MAQNLDLSKRFSKEQVSAAAQTDSQYEDVPAGGYICTIVDAILTDDNAYDRHNICLHVDIAEGDFKGYFLNLASRAGFWGLKGWLSFKESQIGRFQKLCTAFCNSNPGYVFNPFADGGADVDTLVGKKIGVVLGKEEYKSNSGDVREKSVVKSFVEVDKIKKGKFKVPELVKLPQESPSVSADSFMNIGTSGEENPFN